MFLEMIFSGAAKEAFGFSTFALRFEDISWAHDGCRLLFPPPPTEYYTSRIIQFLKNPRTRYLVYEAVVKKRGKLIAIVMNTLVVEESATCTEAALDDEELAVCSDASRWGGPLQMREETKKCRNVVVCRCPLEAESSQIQVQ